MFRATKRILLALLMLVPLAATAQSPSSSSSTSSELLKPEQLDALVAPIALYPDPLLSVVLMASTYPLEVVQADRWITDNKSLNADQLKSAADKQAWDNSVKELVATPSVLSMMSAKLDWTKKLGDAVLAQQPDVMDAVQRLRSRAQQNNKLESTKEQTVTVKQEANRQTIAIEPAVADTIYVPQYDASVFGDWPYPEYPADYYGWPYYGGAILGGGIAFGAGYLLGRWSTGGNIWGGGINWGNRDILANRPAHPIAGAGNRWTHNPAHRQGVRYANANVQQRFGGNRPSNQQRSDLRGRSAQQTLSPKGNRANVGDRTNVGNRANLGNRTASKGTGAAQKAKNRASASNRGGSQRRASTAARPSPRANAPRQNMARANVQRGGRANFAAQRGGRSFASARPAGGNRGGGRRSDIALKHNIVLLGYLDNGVGFYRFNYNGSDRAYVGVMAQEVQEVFPEAVARAPDGYLRVYYDTLGVKFQTYHQWFASGARVPTWQPPRNASSRDTRG